MESLVELFSDQLVATVTAMPVADAPFGAVRLSPQEQLGRYAEMRDNPQAWERMIQEHGLPETLRYMQMMERKRGRQEAENGGTGSAGSGEPVGRPAEAVGTGSLYSKT
jgi:hypothetical protein